jgi:hypothetical protein
MQDGAPYAVICDFGEKMKLRRQWTAQKTDY